MLLTNHLAVTLPLHERRSWSFSLVCYAKWCSSEMCGCVVRRKNTQHRSKSIMNETEQKMKLGSVEDSLIQLRTLSMHQTNAYQRWLRAIIFQKTNLLVHEANFIEIGYCVLGASRYDSWGLTKKRNTSDKPTTWLWLHRRLIWGSLMNHKIQHEQSEKELLKCSKLVWLSGWPLSRRPCWGWKRAPDFLWFVSFKAEEESDLRCKRTWNRCLKRSISRDPWL